MHLLTVFAHPFSDKYPAAVMGAFHEPFGEAGGTIDTLDLYAEGFDPRFTPADHTHYRGGPVPPEIADMHRRVERADRLAFVYPVYWWGMPAIMKGWIERVFTGGWAYQFGGGVDDRGKKPPKGLLRNIPTMLLAMGSATEGTYRKYGYAASMRTQIDVGTLAYCGISDVTGCLIHDMQSDDATRERGLEQARQACRSWLAPDRVVRDAKADHLSERTGGQVSGEARSVDAN